MDPASVFVWRVRLCLLALVLGLANVGGHRPAPQPENLSVQKLPLRVIEAGASIAGSSRVPEVSPTRLGRAQPATVAQRAVHQQCVSRVTRSREILRTDRRQAASANKSLDCKAFTVESGKSIKKTLAAQTRKPASSGRSKIKASTKPSPSAGLPKPRHKLVKKTDGRPGTRIAAMPGRAPRKA